MSTVRALASASRSLVRQPARAGLGVLGVAAVGALLFDMLLLSQGLVVSMRDLLDRTGWDVRVTASGDFPGRGPQIADAATATHAMAQLPAVRSAIALRFADGRVVRPDGTTLVVSFQAVSGGPPRPWTILRGRDAGSAREVVINQRLAGALDVSPHDELVVRATCGDGVDAVPPVRLLVTAVAEFPFEQTSERTIAGSFETLALACGRTGVNRADVVLVASAGDGAAAAAAIEALPGGLRAMTNAEMLGRFQQTGFTYFQQISTVLTTVTMGFAMLLITVLLTVSVNQRIGEIAVLRALGFSRGRVVADVLSESVLIVGAGAVLSLPLGALLAVWLDRILKAMPGIPVQMHFFVYEHRALALHLFLLALTALLAALYPMRIVARLPIAATLRAEGE